ncbi:MAG TPA: HPr family phosphocarrier protein [Candidatus Latescibacteria bacterium]|nr:HPr family phosphocarrier protein [Candidatus Handelsmanbacteria bacterium]HIL08861.1 HPr family phosphocarrier protein [Candidatus Latescibacterota bacterium]
MVEKTATINNPLGIHARPAALLVQAAARFKAEIYFSKDDVEQVNGKSIMGVMMLAAEQGAHITVKAEGEDAEAAVEVLFALLQSNFEEQS